MQKCKECKKRTCGACNATDHQQEADAAFEKALKSGRLLRDKTAVNYVGHYMYMGPGKGGDAFKHSLTRQYID